MDLRHITTDRLQLDAVVPGDLEEHFALLSDPGSWRHLPSSRHTSPEQTMAGTAHSVCHWACDGLGYWTARLRADLPEAGVAAGSLAGTGNPDPAAVRWSTPTARRHPDSSC